jgi:hypothetical protein
VLDRQPELKGQRLILLIDRDSFKTIKVMGYKIFTRLTQGTVKVLRDPEEAPKQEEGAATNPASSRSVSEGNILLHPPRLEPRSLNSGGQQRWWEKCLQPSNLPL